MRRRPVHDPAGGAYSASSDTLVGLKRRQMDGRGKEKGKRSGEEWWEKIGKGKGGKGGKQRRGEVKRIGGKGKGREGKETGVSHSINSWIRQCILQLIIRASRTINVQHSHADDSRCTRFSHSLPA